MVVSRQDSGTKKNFFFFLEMKQSTHCIVLNCDFWGLGFPFLCMEGENFPIHFQTDVCNDILVCLPHECGDCHLCFLVSCGSLQMRGPPSVISPEGSGD